MSDFQIEFDPTERENQNKLLHFLYKLHPDGMDDDEYQEAINIFGSYREFLSSLVYLVESGLISRDSFKRANSDHSVVVRPWMTVITRDGIDYLRCDGGLSAILNVTTIKFHDDSIEALKSIIMNSSQPHEHKQKLIRELSKLPAESIRHLVLKLLDAGISRVPDVFQLIQTALHSA